MATVAMLKKKRPDPILKKIGLWAAGTRLGHRACGMRGEKGVEGGDKQPANDVHRSKFKFVRMSSGVHEPEVPS
jgi:hypothetical protein